jgi:UDP-3-O-[3-hydroxymyristoyl] glucosamine N-acyltransferase
VKKLGELAALVGGQVEGNAALEIEGVAGLEEAAAGQLTFYGNTRYKKALALTKALAVLVGADAPARRTGLTYVRVENPHLAFAQISQSFYPRRAYAPGRSDRAFIHPDANVHPDATVMAFATVEQGAMIGARAVLHPGVFVGEHAQIGDGSVLHPNVTVYDRCVIGQRCILHAGAVVGADGFGFAFDPKAPEHVKIPQAGIARLEDDVELGACSCIDRATLGETVVGRGTKIDNLVQVAHNVTVGPLSLLCAQAGISGSTTLGHGVVLGGQAGLAGHLKIGNLARIGAQAGVPQDVEEGASLMGTPTMPMLGWYRSSATFEKLPEMARELRALRKRVDELTAALPEITREKTK